MNPIWRAQRKTVSPGFSERTVIINNDSALSFDEAIASWRDDAMFRAFTCATLADVPYPAFFWEMPPVRRGATDAPYEFMVIRSDALARMRPDAEAFAAQFPSAGSVVAAFSNLGGDAILVAPEQIAAADCYPHLGAFVRSAPKAQQQALFQTLGHAIDDFLGRYDRRVWISTSGLGVAWLHVRLDTVPKYYQHQPYARM